MAIRATEEALDRRPDLTVAVVRARLERSARRRTGEPLTATLGVRVAVRAIDVHPVVGERLVRLWLRRAARREAEAIERARTVPEDGSAWKAPALSLDSGIRGSARSR